MGRLLWTLQWARCRHRGPLKGTQGLKVRDEGAVLPAWGTEEGATSQALHGAAAASWKLKGRQPTASQRKAALLTSGFQGLDLQDCERICIVLLNSQLFITTAMRN